MYVCGSYLLQLLDDGHRQLTDIFTVWTSCLLLLSFSVGGTKLSFLVNVCHTLVLFDNQRTEREMCGFISSGK